jgi:hypothetical protein
MTPTKEEKLRTAMDNARLFIQRGEELLTAYELGTASPMRGCRESGAAKRASMELSRSLADYRRPW